jgi:hypothetical protein
MLNLLKEKSKVNYKPKTRRKFKPYMPATQSTQPVTLHKPQLGTATIIPKPKTIVPTILENYDKDKDKEMK